MLSALAGAAPPTRRMRPLSTTITWLAAAVPVSGSMRRPARIAMGWAARVDRTHSERSTGTVPVGQAIRLPCATGRRIATLSFLRMDRHREVVVAGVGEAKSDAALGVEGHGGGAVDAGEHPTGGQAHEIQGPAQRARPDQLTVTDKVAF